MNPEHLVLIESNLNAQKLISVWSGLVRDWNAKYHAHVDALYQAGNMQAVFREWGRSAAVNHHLAEDIGTMLLRNQICYADGSTDKMALAYIQSQSIKRAGMTAKPKQKEP